MVVKSSTHKARTEATAPGSASQSIGGVSTKVANICVGTTVLLHLIALMLCSERICKHRLREFGCFAQRNVSGV